MTTGCESNGDGRLDLILRKLEALLQRGDVALERRWLSVASAAIYTDSSQDWIRALIARGELAAHRPQRGKILLDRRQLDAVIEGSTSRVRTSRGSAARQRRGNGQYAGRDGEEGPR